MFVLVFVCAVDVSFRSYLSNSCLVFFLFFWVFFTLLNQKSQQLHYVLNVLAFFPSFVYFADSELTS